jgi:hypothetical protein
MGKSAAARRVPLIADSARLFLRQDRAIDINAVAHQESRLQTAPLVTLALEHDELSRWLNRPYAEMWADDHAVKTERIKAVWQAIRRRFPEYAARQMR